MRLGFRLSRSPLLVRR